MPLMGEAAVAMWWSVRLEQRSEFGDWHSHEHFPERMSIPGFRRGSRWTSTTDADGFFVLYELGSYDVLTSTGYLDRLNAPTPWSTKMMPHHLGMVRAQCRIAASFGGGIAGSVATIRFSPDRGRADDLRASITPLIGDLPSRPGLTGAHLLHTDTPKTSSSTTEQRIRGSDRTADWIVLLSGYDRDAVKSVIDGDLSADALRRAGASDSVVAGFYTLAYAMTPQDLASGATTK